MKIDENTRFDKLESRKIYDIFVHSMTEMSIPFREQTLVIFQQPKFIVGTNILAPDGMPVTFDMYSIIEGSKVDAVESYKDFGPLMFAGHTIPEIINLISEITGADKIILKIRPDFSNLSEFLKSIHSVFNIAWKYYYSVVGSEAVSKIRRNTTFVLKAGSY